ncbi:hypothetical protein GCM10011513_15950 [Franconibacter daqui]|nr:hypothetical protein GCM10011513_15950 [Franconibacter daqui]
MKEINASKVEMKKPKPTKTLGPIGIDLRANPGPGIHTKITARLAIISSKLTAFLPFDSVDLDVIINNFMSPRVANKPITMNTIAIVPVKNELNTFIVTDILLYNSATLLII